MKEMLLHRVLSGEKIECLPCTHSCMPAKFQKKNNTRERFGELEIWDDGRRSFHSLTSIILLIRSSFLLTCANDLTSIQLPKLANANANMDNDTLCVIPGPEMIPISVGVKSLKKYIREARNILFIFRITPSFYFDLTGRHFDNNVLAIIHKMELL